MIITKKKKSVLYSFSRFEIVKVIVLLVMRIFVKISKDNSIRKK